MKTPKHRPLARNRDPRGQQEGYRETSHQRVVTETHDDENEIGTCCNRGPHAYRTTGDGRDQPLADTDGRRERAQMPGTQRRARGRRHPGPRYAVTSHEPLARAGCTSERTALASRDGSPYERQDREPHS